MPGFVMRKCYAFALSRSLYEGSDPNGIRTRVTAVKGRCPRPLDDRVGRAANIRSAHPAGKSRFSRMVEASPRKHQSGLVLIKIELRAPAPRLDGVSPYQCVLAKISLVGRRSAEPQVNKSGRPAHRNFFNECCCSHGCFSMRLNDAEGIGRQLFSLRRVTQ